MKKIATLLLICLVAVAAFNASAVNPSIYEIDEGSLVGDVNYDSKVNVTDVTTLVNMILGVVPKDMERADIDSNGKINVSDVTALINIILGTTSGGTTGGTKLQMQEWFENSAQLPYIPMHEWTDGDVIFLAIDPVGNEVCQNVYAMVRTGGKWVLQDVNGSNKQGFKTSGGTVSAVYVQDANLAECYYNYIPITRDVACVSKAGTYTVTPKNGKYYITLNGLYFYHFVSRIDVNAAQEGDYFYGSVTHLDALTKVSWMPTYGYSAFETSHRAPIIDIDSNHKGHAYGVWQMGTRVDGWLSLDYVKSNGYAYYWNYGQNKLYQGRYLTSIYSPWQNAWNRDLSMRYYNHDDNKTYRLNASTPGDQDVNINVGTNIIFRPYNGDNTDSNGTMTSVTSSTSGILDINSSNDQVSVVAHKVGTTTLTIKFKTKDGINTTYTYNVTVNPTVWAAGKTRDNKPILWRNWQDKSIWLGGKDNYVAATKILVHGSNATVLYRKDNVSYKTYIFGGYPYDWYYYKGGTAAVAKATAAHGGGIFNIYTSGLSGSQHKINQYLNFEGAPLMWTDKSGNIYYTTSTRSTQNDSEGENNGCVVNTSVYKNKTKLLTIDNFVITDLAVSESTGKIYVIGNSTNSQQVVGSLGVITGSTPQYYPITPPAHDYWIFTRMYLDQNTETVYIEGLNGHYSTIGGGQGYLWRYTASAGLTLYTDVDLGTADNYNYFNNNSMQNSTLAVLEGLRKYPFSFYSNKFYYLKHRSGSGNTINSVSTYQLGASQTAAYSSLPSEAKPMFFDVKNGWMGMTIYTDSNKPYQVTSFQLNSYRSGIDMENSVGAIIYDVWLQTSLDD